MMTLDPSPNNLMAQKKKNICPDKDVLLQCPVQREGGGKLNMAHVDGIVQEKAFVSELVW